MNSANIEKKKYKSSEKIWLIAVIVIAAAVYYPALQYLWSKWLSDAQYSLAFLVPIVSGYFVWKKWPEVIKIERSPSILGLVLIILGLFIHTAGTVLDISGPSAIAVYMTIFGFCLYFHGPALVKTLWFPLAYTFFALPIPGGILDLVGFPLQLWASGATAGILRTMGMEVYRSGVNLSVPGFDFQVAQACSGMSSLVALVGVTAVFAYVTKLPNVYKWILFALALPIALIANIVRITTIALVGYQWGPDAAMNIFHDWSSPILFMCAIGLMFLFNWGFEWLSGRQTTS